MVAVGLACCKNDPGVADRTFVLFVSDTTRVDAVSAYGEAQKTTPNFDRLAAEGVLYRRAYSNAPWTLPSHATMFTGLLPSEHSVGMTRTRAGDSLEFLAERLKQAGFQTLGFSENDWISERFNLVQGFDHFRTMGKMSAHRFASELDSLMELRQPNIPAFIFINVMNAHGPFRYWRRNPFLERDLDSERAVEAITTIERRGMCSATELGAEYEILRQVYLHGVHRADAKLGVVLERVAREHPRTVVTIATSDHGHHFGERRLTGHQYSVREELVRVPLVVHGLPGVRPTTVDAPVQLADLAPSILSWANAQDLPYTVGQPLPLESRGLSRRPVIAEYADTTVSISGDKSGFLKFLGHVRSACGPEHRVFGDMRAFVRYPYKLISFERYPSELYDLSNDPWSRRDLASDKPKLVAELEAEMAEHLSALQPPPDDSSVPIETVPPETIERLRNLGYDVGT